MIKIGVSACYACVVACKDWNDIQTDEVNWRRCETIEKGRFPNLFVSFLTISCLHCENPACEDVCPSGAIEKREDNGIVVVDQDICLGTDCEACADACPYSIPQFGEGTDSKMEKCDFCLERWAQGKKPICVNSCPTRALDAGPIGELQEKYGGIRLAEGFIYSEQTKPAIIFRPKIAKNASF